MSTWLRARRWLMYFFTLALFLGLALLIGPRLTRTEAPSQVVSPELTLAQHQSAPQRVGSVGAYALWSKIEIEMTGPASEGLGEPNPFATMVDVTFVGPSGQSMVVPAFYDGNGMGGLDGDVWKVRFAADEVGEWTFESFSHEPLLDNYTGSFTVSDTPANAPGFFKWGRLESMSTAENEIRYLKFRDGPYWLKAGSDDPEGFLSPTLEHYNSNTLRKQAIDYWAGKGINSLYIMTHKIDGDEPADVYPWVGATASEAKGYAGDNARFNVAKLAEWHEIFAYMNEQGVVPYLILEDDSAWTGLDYGRYYREMIARFGYLPALLFNYAEEHNERHTLIEALAHMELMSTLDPFNHPRSIHNVNNPNNDYIDAEYVTSTSIQTDPPESPASHNQRVIAWIEAAKSRNKRVPMIGYDEGRPSDERASWWSVYIGGGVWESIWGKVHWTTEDQLWTELGGTRTFMESLPFWEMTPNNAVVVSGEAFALVKEGEAYAFYLPNGGSIQVNLATDAGYDYAWWNPANGKDGTFQNGGTIGGGVQTFTPPDTGDWALRLLNNGNPPPTPSCQLVGET